MRFRHKTHIIQASSNREDVAYGQSILPRKTRTFMAYLFATGEIAPFASMLLKESCRIVQKDLSKNSILGFATGKYP